MENKLKGGWKAQCGYTHMDKLEKMRFLKDFYPLGGWKKLNNIDQFTKADFADILNIEDELKLTSAKQVHSFLFECSKNNIGDSRQYLRIMNSYLGLDSRNRD